MTCIPGSCIKPVYELTSRQYQEIEEAGKRELDQIVSRAFEAVSMPKDGVLVMNTLGYERDDLVMVEGDRALSVLTDEQGRRVPMQKTADGRYLLYVDHIPPLGL